MFKKFISTLLATILTCSALMPLTAIAQTEAEATTEPYDTFKSHFINLGGDPWVTYHDGWYYYMVTGNGFYVAKSRELERVNSNPVSVFNISDLGDGVNLSIAKELWAPELHFIDGYWYIYFTAYDGESYAEGSATTVTGTAKNHRMYVLKSKTDDAQGEYEFIGQIKELDSDYSNDSGYKNATYNIKPGHWAIDQTVFKWNGKLYTAWSGWSGYTNVDQRIYIAEMSDPCTISSKRVELSRPEFAYETYSVIPAVNEGPQALISPDGKTLNIAFSVNRFDDPSYALGMLTLKPSGDPLNSDDWTKTENPVFETNEENSTYSVGHCSFVASPDKSEYYVVYHARGGEDTTTNPREIRTQQFFWNEDGTPHFSEALNAADLVPVPSGTANLNRTEIEAEDAILSGGAFVVTADTNGIDTYNDDYYSGGKRISLAGSGRNATFTYNAEKAGKYTITLLASGNSGTNSGLLVTVNGTEYAKQIKGGSNNVNNFTYYDITGVELREGENTIIVGHTPTYKNGAYLDRLDITNEQDAADKWALQDEANRNTDKAPTLLKKATEPLKYAVYNKEYTFNSFGDFDKYWFSTEPFVNDTAFENVITTCRPGGNKRLFVTGEEFKNVGDFKASVEIIPTAARLREDGIQITAEPSINSGILFRVGEMKDYTTNVSSFDGYRCFLIAKDGVVKMQLHRYYFANETATTSSNELIKTVEATLPYTPGDTYVIELSCVGNVFNAVAYNKNNENEVIRIENQSIETSVAETIDLGRIGLFTNCVSRVAFKDMKVTVLDKKEPVTQNFDNSSDFEIKTNAPAKLPTFTDGNFVTSTGALKLQALDTAIEYKETTFKDFYNIANYDIYGNKYHTTNNKVATYGAQFDNTNNVITTADSLSKLKLDGTEGMTDFKAVFTVTKIGANSLYGGIAFKINDDDFRTSTFGTQGYMLFVNSEETSTDVKITFRKYSTATTYEKDEIVATGLLSAAKNGVKVKIDVSGNTVNITIADAENLSSTYTKQFNLIPTSTNGAYYNNGSFAFVSNGNHTFKDISLIGTVPTNYTVHEEGIHNLSDRNYYTIHGNTTGDDIVDYGITFKDDKISTAGQSKIKINGNSNVEDLKASFNLKKTNGNALYGGLAFRIQDYFFTKATYGTPGYMIFAYSAANSMDLSLRMRNYSTASAFAYKEVIFEGFLAAPDNKNIRMELEVIGNTLNVNVYDLSDAKRKASATFNLANNATDIRESAKAGGFKGGSIALVSNGTHDFSDISVTKLVKEAPYTIVKNFEAQADFKLPSATTVQTGIMFYVSDAVNRVPGLTAFSLNAIRTKDSNDNAMTLQLVRYGTKSDGTTNVNLGAVSGSTKEVANILTTPNGSENTVRVKIKVIKGILYYSLTNVSTGKTSDVYSIPLNNTSTFSKYNYTAQYNSGGIGIFTYIANVNVSNFSVRSLSDCIVSITEANGGTVSGDGIYAYSESVTLTATPEYGYRFAGWYNGSELVTTEESYSFTATENVVLTPKFIALPFKFTGTDSKNSAAVINIDSIENVSEIGFEVTVKSENNEIKTDLSTKYINALSENQKPWIATANKVYYCDMNGDGTADSLDLTVLRKGLLGKATLKDVTADLNGDGNVSLKDLVCLKKAEADLELEFSNMEEGYNYPFVFGNLLNDEGKQYVELKPYSIIEGKKEYSVTRYLSYNGKELVNSSTSANHTPFGKIRIACVGDSITQGVGATGWASGDYTYAYPQQLQSILGDDYLVGNFGKGGAYVYNIGRDNTTLYYPNTTEYTNSNAFDADIVIIKLGTNDARVMHSEADSAGWKECFKELVNHYKNLESSPTVYVMSSITMKNYDQEKEASLVTHILPQQKAVANELGCVFLDSYNDLYDIFSSGEGFASDGLHPNNTGYAAMAEYVKNNITLDIFY